MSTGRDDGGAVTSNTVAGDVCGVVVQAGSVAGGVHFHHHTTPGQPVSRVGRLAQRPPWLARLPRGDDTVAGAGVLVDERHVITCAHVVGQQAGRPLAAAGAGQQARGEVLVEFPFAAGVTTRRATVVGRQPIACDGSGDAAVLRLVEPVALTPAPLACRPSPHGHGFWAHGFPGGRPAAGQARGRLGGSSGPAGEWIDVEPGDTGQALPDAGFSGAPVFDQDADAVVGIYVSRDERGKPYLLPVSYLRALWPWLELRVGWRLDLDPALKTHWLPRARGSEVESDSGVWFFSGRQAARQRICDWLADPDQPALVVTGGPGTGKSALLSHLLVAADPILASSVPTGGPRPPHGAFDVAVQVTGMSRDEVVERLATASGVEAATPQELLVALRERRQTDGRAFTVLADALEEAATHEEALRIVALLRNLATSRVARVLAGVRTAPAGSDRARVLESFGRTTPRVDLESYEFLRNYDIADYAERRLTGEDGESARYRDRPRHELREIGRAVARKARYNFLIAQLATRWLTHPATPPLDLDDPAWEHGLPETIGQAMDAYLDACGPETALVRRLLTALAFARGDGLTRDDSWLTIADALHRGRTHSLGELETVFHGAANYLIERSSDNGEQPSYRLYHNALDEHLREQCPAHKPQRAIADALTAAAPLRDGRRDWATAAPYARTHLAGHAAQAHQLDDLLADVGFLLHAEPGPLLAALPHATTEKGHLTAVVYRMTNHQHRQAHPGTRCRILALDAARLGARDLQHQLNAAQSRLGTDAAGPAWRVRFATGSSLPTATIGTLTGHEHGVGAVAVTELDDRPVAVVGGYNSGTLWLWDLAEQQLLGQFSATYRGGVKAVAVGELDGRPIAVTGGFIGADVPVWDLTEQRRIGRCRDFGGAGTLAVGEWDGRPIAVTGQHRSETVRVWDLAECRLLAEIATGCRRGVHGVAVGELDGRPVAVTGGIGDPHVRVWDLAGQRQIGQPLTGHTQGIGAVAVGRLNGRTIAVTGGISGDCTVRVWDLAEQRQIGQPLTGHTQGINAIAVGTLGDRAIAVTGGGVWDGTVRVWDLAEQRQIGRPLIGHAQDVSAVAVAELDGLPIAVTGGGGDETVRVWNLAEQHRIGHPVTGHRSDVEAVAVGELDGRSIAVTGDSFGDCAVRVWDLAGQRQIGRPLTGHSAGVNAMAVGELDDLPVAITASGLDKTARIWDLAGQREIGRFPAGDLIGGDAVAIGELNGRPITVHSGIGLQVRVWDLVEQREIGQPLVGHTHKVKSIAVGELDGRTIVLSGGVENVVRVWDLAGRRQIGHISTTHSRGVTAVAVGELDGRAVAVTGGGTWDETVRVWDLRDGSCVDELTMPGPVACMALGRDGTLALGFGHDIAVFDTDFHNPARIRLRSASLGGLPGDS
ncbi:trypsin-like peptidase domain-containing protein [Streptomyces iranensis]|uniref:WD40 repeat protein n=1 Tax=Streptomyces iranensis TaxID=576784 RepID=A0ABS4NAN3_9ACTN|nr:trypsin-like peptidase domain-containing protein [Streptomyces iranensis]MBP2068476.1 WD40 repeat protein [Streptomyces iranensis]